MHDPAPTGMFALLFKVLSKAFNAPSLSFAQYFQLEILKPNRSNRNTNPPAPPPAPAPAPAGDRQLWGSLAPESKEEDSNDQTAFLDVKTVARRLATGGELPPLELRAGGVRVVWTRPSDGGSRDGGDRKRLRRLAKALPGREDEVWAESEEEE